MTFEEFIESTQSLCWSEDERELVEMVWQAAQEADRESSDEPVGYLTYIEDAGMLFTQDEPERGVYEPVYARPQPKARLTGEEILDAANSADFKNMVTADDFIFVIARAIERKVWEIAE
jgi:hypothetical protein